MTDKLDAAGDRVVWETPTEMLDDIWKARAERDHQKEWRLAVIESASAQIDGLFRLLMQAERALKMSTHWQICPDRACDVCQETMNEHVRVQLDIDSIVTKTAQAEFRGRIEGHRPWR